MHARHIVLAVFAAAVTLTAVASAGPVAAKQRVAITVMILPSGRGVLTPLKDGAVERDSGTLRGDWSPIPDRTVMREGQTVGIHTADMWTFTGKRGKVVFRERNEWVDLGHDQNRDGFGDEIANGTWKVVRGTGRYAGITGGGRSAHLGLGNKWVARYEGFLTVP
jgi:hypothetical protein